MSHAFKLNLTLQYVQESPLTTVVLPRSTLRGWVMRALEQDAALTLRFVGRHESRALNRIHRGKDYATNVLTFAYGSDEFGVLGADIIICVPVLVAEAKAAKKTLRHHAAHLIIHGVLHAQGYDHEKQRQAAVMEQREIQLLAALKIPNPYA